MNIQFDQIPSSLKARPQWLCWRVESRPGSDKPTKVPYHPRGYKVSDTDPAAWVSFEEAVKAAPRFDGVGYVFSADDPYFGLDLDQMRDPDSGQLTEEARAHIAAFGTYAEVTPSGRGVHIIGIGTLPGPGRHPANKHMELYDRARYFTFTGQHIDGTPAEPQPVNGILTDLYDALGAEKPPTAGAAQNDGTSRLTDDDVIARGHAAANGAKFAALWSGDTSAQGGNHSAADQALCNHLAFWCGNDAAQMDRLFRRSGLFRPKWGRKLGSTTYGLHTIEEARRITAQTYTPPSPAPILIRGGRRVDPDTGEIAGTSRTLYEHTDLGNGSRFADTYRGELVYARYGTTTGDWRRWDGTRWALAATDELIARAGSLARTMYLEAADNLLTDAGKALAKHALRTQAEGRLLAMCTLAKNGLGTWAHDYDTDPWLLNCPNGALDLRTGVLHPHDPEHRITKRAGTPYDPDALCPMFDYFLHAILPEEGVQEFVQRAAGYSLTGLTTEQCLMFCHGVGSNGKSTLLAALEYVMGDYATAARAETFMSKSGDNGGANNDIADLMGARLVVSGELEDGKRFAEALIKHMTGQDVLKARFLHKEYFTYTPSFKIWLQANHKPTIRGTDDGIWRRIRLVPFTTIIADEDRIPQLGELLRAEAAGILAWAVRGCLAWQRGGALTPPDEVRAATAKYRIEMDVLGSFLDEMCDMGVEERTPKKNVYAVYRQWAESNEEYKMSQNMFSRRMTERGFKEDRREDGRLWVGLRLKSLRDS